MHRRQQAFGHMLLGLHRQRREEPALGWFIGAWWEGKRGDIWAAHTPAAELRDCYTGGVGRSRARSDCT